MQPEAPASAPRRVLLASTSEKGHLNPLVAVAQRLSAAGHAVGWLILPEGHSPQVDALAGAVGGRGAALRGRPSAPAGPAPAGSIEVLGCPGIDPPPLATSGPELARLVRDRPALRAWIRTLLIDAVPAQIEPVRATLRRWRPDVVATDPMLYQVALASHHEGLRWLGVSSSLNPVVPPTMDAELVRTLADLAPARGRLFADHGLPDVAFAVADHLSPWGTTVFATAAYAGVFGPSPPGVSLVGPSTPAGPRGDEPAFPWQILPERPLIYASFGSQVAWQPERFDRLALATASLGVTLVLSLGNLAGTPWARALPEHVVGVPYAPQRALLERAAAFVTHGGANSVMEALTAGTPLLISPICNDQPLQARFVRAAGVGLECDLDVASVDEVRGGLASLLAGEGAPRLPEVAASYRAHDGAAAVARLALALAE